MEQPKVDALLGREALSEAFDDEAVDLALLKRRGNFDGLSKEVGSSAPLDCRGRLLFFKVQVSRGWPVKPCTNTMLPRGISTDHRVDSEPTWESLTRLSPLVARTAR